MQEPAFALERILPALGLDETSLPRIEQGNEYPTFRQAQTPSEIYEAIRRVGVLTDTRDRAEELAESLEERTNLIAHKLKFIAADQKPSVLCLHGLLPTTIVPGSYLDSLVRLAGGTPINALEGDEIQPDILVILSDQPLASLFGELPALLASHAWAATPAVANNNIYIIQDAEALRQPGLRVADDAEILAEIISSKYFVFGHEGTAWIRFGLS